MAFLYYFFFLKSKLVKHSQTTKEACKNYPACQWVKAEVKHSFAFLTVHDCSFSIPISRLIEEMAAMLDHQHKSSMADYLLSYGRLELFEGK